MNDPGWGGGVGEGALSRFLEGERDHREETTQVSRPELELDPGSGFRRSLPEFKVCTSPLQGRSEGTRAKASLEEF